MPKPTIATLAATVALTCIYFAAGKLGLSLAFVNASASAVWPPTGIALAVLLVLGYRAWPAILIGAFLVNISTSGSIAASLVIAVGNTLEGLIGAYLVDRFAHGRHAFDHARDIFKFAFLAGAIATALSASIGVIGLVLTGLAHWNDFPDVWFTWWIGDATGALIVTPALVLWANAVNGWSRRRALEAALVLLCLVFASLMVFGDLSYLGLENYPVAFLVLPVVVWCAFRLGPRETATATLILAAITVWGTLHGFGPFARYPNNEALLLLQTFTAVLTMTCLSLAAVVAQRARAEEQYRLITDTATDAILTIDKHSVITFANAAVETIFGYRVSELLGQNLTVLMPEHLRRIHSAALDRYTTTHKKHMPWAGVELPGVHKDGHELALEISFAEFKRDGKQLFTGIVRDISERKRAEESQRWLATIVESSSDAVIGKTLDGVVLSWNEAAEKIYGYTAAEAIGRSISILLPDDRADEAPQILERIRQGERIKHFETERLRKDGERISVSLTMSPIRDASGTIRGVSTIARDITEHKRAEERIRYMAQHDALTGLPNRTLFRDRIRQAIAQAERTEKKVAVMFLDLDDFKSINDSLGHQVGDHLLRMVARRLQRCVRQGDSIARLGGDEFVISLLALPDTADAMSMAEKVLQSLRAPFPVNEHELHVSGSIGISIYPNDGHDVDFLMRSADTAMYHAKSKGRDNYQFFTPRLNDAAQRRLSIANRLHQALPRNELMLEYQPQVDLQSGKIVGAEALLRWRQPELGLVSPLEFIAVAEDTGLIAPIGQWVLYEACQQLKRWRAAGYSELRMAVNVSPQEFRRPNYPDIAASILREVGLPPAAVEMEITESMLVMQSHENAAALEQIARTGIRLAVDDFGTGYSGLAYLQRFPIHTLKIDRSFVDGIGDDTNDMTIVNAIIAMSHSLHLHVVAEGVETAAQAAFLKMHGCLAAQGYYYSRPVGAEAFAKLLGRSIQFASRA